MRTVSSVTKLGRNVLTVTKIEPTLTRSPKTWSVIRARVPGLDHRQDADSAVR